MPFSLVPDDLFDVYTQVTPDYLRKHGIRLLLSDLDFTLAAKHTRQPDQTLLDWIESLRQAGIGFIIVSNNRSGERVREFCGGLGIPYVGRAGKPRRGGLLSAMEEGGGTPDTTAMLGDKLLTDALGAKRCGFLALTVEPVGGAVTAWQRVLHALQEPSKRTCRRRGAKNRDKN